MPKGSKCQKPPLVAPNPPAKAIQSWDNEGGAPSMGDRSGKKGKDEKPFFGDFIEHPGSVGEMHFPYENRKKRPRDTNPLVPVSWV
jgi:hypothetical protein